MPQKRSKGKERAPEAPRASRRSHRRQSPQREHERAAEAPAGKRRKQEAAAPAPACDLQATAEAALRNCEAAIAQLQEKLLHGAADAPEVPSADQQALVTVYDEMLRAFNTKHYQRKYGGSAGEGAFATRLLPGDPVPMYFANVSNGSIFLRKLLSIAGLRNLVLYGPEIFHELRVQLFISDPRQYAPGTGLERMRLVTGNIVDLDTVVLRCSDPTVLQTINLMNRKRKQPQYEHPDEFGESEQAQEIALAAAGPLLDGFAAEFKLSRQQRAQRRIDLNVLRGRIPVAQSNNDRGRWPVWQYVNVGVNSFHANVPHMPDVVGALLRAPVAAVRAYLRCRGDPARLERFFEDGISDSCFNGKWKALEEFNARLDGEGTIKHVLEALQAENQHVFTSELFDLDDDAHTQEISELWQLARGREGRDAAGVVRPITRTDVERWVAKPDANPR